jgi:hypothetical protein
MSEIVVKGPVWFAIAWGVSFLLRHRSAALRHFIWFVAVLGILVLPLFVTGLPDWRVAWLPVWGRPVPELNNRESPRGLISGSALQVSENPSGTGSDRRLPATLTSEKPAVASASLSPERRPPAGAGPVWWSVVWGVGTVLTLLPLLVAGFQVRQVIRSSRRVIDPDW